MIVFRIYKDGRLPYDTTGARTSGGRWNKIGHGMLYTSTHLSLSALEKLVNLTKGEMPEKLCYASGEIPDDIGFLDPDRKYVHMGPDYTANLGTGWLMHNNELAVRVPSVLIPMEDNVLLNPSHPDFPMVYWDTAPFDWDARILELLIGKRTA